MHPLWRSCVVQSHPLCAAPTVLCTRNIQLYSDVWSACCEVGATSFRSHGLGPGQNADGDYSRCRPPPSRYTAAFGWTFSCRRPWPNHLNFLGSDSRSLFCFCFVFFMLISLFVSHHFTLSMLFRGVLFLLFFVVYAFIVLFQFIFSVVLSIFIVLFFFFRFCVLFFSSGLFV